MNYSCIMRILSICFGLSCISVLTAAENTGWVLGTDFQSSELANLKLTEEHELLLRTLAKREAGTVQAAFFFELISKSFDNEFFGLVTNKSTNRENTAIVKAAFDSLAKLTVVNRVLTVLQTSGASGVDYVKSEGKNIGEGFSRVCAKIDEELKNEDIYTSLKEEYQMEFQKANSWLPKKRYMYSIPRTENEFRKEFAEYADEPQMKTFRTHLAMFLAVYSHDTDAYTALTVLRMARIPNIAEEIQRIYDEVSAQVSSQAEDYAPHEIRLTNTPIDWKVNTLVPILTGKLKENIIAVPHLLSIYQKLYGNIRD